MKQLYQIALWFLMVAVLPITSVAQNNGVIIDTTVCGSFEWHGSTYTVSDTLVFNPEDSSLVDTTIYLTVNLADSVEFTKTACEEYAWNGVTYNTSGNYTQTFTNNHGCDSVVTLHLTVNPPAHSSTTIDTCESYTWTDGNGQTYTTSDDYTYSHQDANGCTQVDTLHLTIRHGTHNVETETTCESFTWHDSTYTTSGSYTYAYTNNIGCQSVDTLKLTVNYGTHNVETETTCESFIWHDSTYTTSGTYTYAYTNNTGCQSVDTLKLTVNHPAHMVTTAGSCGSFTWHDSTYTESGDYTYSHPDANDCTQVDTLHLTVYNPVHTAVTVEACESYMWMEGTGGTYTTSDTYTYAHQDTHGCWQVDTLHLTINHPVTVHFDKAICSSSLPLTWHDTTFDVGTVSGDYILHRKTVQNCDSIITLTLTVNSLPTVIISGEGSFCQGNSTTLTASGASSYTWNNGSHNATTTVSTGGTYIVTGTDANGCINTVGKTVTVNQTYNIPITASICQDDTLNFFGQFLTDAGSYTHTLYTSKGCDSVITLTLTVNPLPVVTISGNTSICQGQTTTLTASGASTYVWGNASTSSSITVNHADTYSVTGTGANGCTKTVTKTVTVNPTYNIPVSESRCQGQSYNFYGQILTTSGVYTHTLSTSKGCDSVITLTLTVNPLPNVTISGESSFCQGDNVTLTASGASSYAWNDESQNTFITVNTANAGNFTYTVTGTDANGCTNTAAKTVTVNPTYNTTVYDTICYGESYNFFGENLTTAGQYTHTLYTSKGCDSIISLMLTVNPLPNVTITGDTFFCEGTSTTLIASGASSYTWSNGSTTNETTVNYAGFYMVTATDANGCRNTDSLSVTEIPTQTSSISATGCEEYTWNGTVYYTSGDYTQTFPAASGCDSIVTLHLTIHHGTHNVFTETVCESYTWHGTTYTASGTYTYPYNNEYGCPSEDTLHLTVNYGIHNVFAETACESYTWHGTTYTASGIYTYLYTTANGCASADTLHLIINHPVHTATSITMCDSYTWAEGTGQTYTTSGTYTYTHQDSHGCTQVDTLHLVINPNPTPFIVGDSTICYGEVATLTAAGGETYQWSTEDVGNSIVVAIEGLYTVTATNMYGCSSTAEFTVNIATSPLVKKDIVGKSHADGSQYMLIYPEAGLQYQWYKNKVVIEGATKQYYYPSDYTLEGSLDMDACYQVVVRPNDPDFCGIMTDCWGKTESATEKIRILPNPNDGRFRLLLPADALNVRIFNANGQLVLSRKTDGATELEMDTGLANGLYFVKTYRQDGSFNTEKLIINR